MVLQGHHGDVVGFHRVGYGNDRTGAGLNLTGLIIEHPVGNVFDAFFGQHIDGFEGFRQARAFPAAGRLAGEIPDCLDGFADSLTLVVELVHGPLQIPMTHEFPAGFEGGFGDPGVGFTDDPVDGQGRRDPEGLQTLVKTPEPDPHAVFVPGPVGQVRQQRLTHGRRQNLARHGIFDAPFLNVDDGPDGHTGAVGKCERRPVDDGGIWNSVFRDCHGLSSCGIECAVFLFRHLYTFGTVE